MPGGGTAPVARAVLAVHWCIAIGWTTNALKGPTQQLPYYE